MEKQKEEDRLSLIELKARKPPNNFIIITLPFCRRSKRTPRKRSSKTMIKDWF